MAESGSEARMNRRGFLAGAAGAGIAVRNDPGSAGQSRPRKVIRVGVIGCGSVSGKYLPNLAQCPYAEVVSVCDIIPERAERRAAEHRVPNRYPHIDAMLDGEPFDLFVNLTDMQEHYRLNRQAIQAGKHVWSEKPIANTREQGEELIALAKQKGVRLWGAPTAILSPQFAFMAKTLASGALGPISAAHASYGHLGPDWSSFFYEKLGGPLPDLAVYNMLTLTGLLGPAREVMAMTQIITPTRQIRGKGERKVEVEDNAMVMMRHASGALSHLQSGFNFFTAREHDYTDERHHTISIIGRSGSMHLAGYDWAPHAVDIATQETGSLQRRAEGAQGYVWENGASHVAECLATGKETLLTPEQSVHVVEIIQAARQSQKTGRRIAVTSSFRWPIPV